MQVFLETERLLLRRFTPDDAEHLIALDSDPAVMRFISGGTPTPPEEMRDNMLPHILRYYEQYDGYGFWAVIEKATGDFLGWFHFRPWAGSDRDEPELGYRLRQSAWGKGYATEGSRALIRKGFTDLGVRRVVASAYGENIGSRRVMEKAGMRLVRTFRMTPEEFAAHGIPYDAGLWDGDDVEYAIERAEWVAQEAAGAQ
jgi:RimJ/RimL family protein N-acetyltransferase